MRIIYTQMASNWVIIMFWLSYNGWLYARFLILFCFIGDLWGFAFFAELKNYFKRAPLSHPHKTHTEDWLHFKWWKKTMNPFNLRQFRVVALCAFINCVISWFIEEGKYMHEISCAGSLTRPSSLLPIPVNFILSHKNVNDIALPSRKFVSSLSHQHYFILPKKKTWDKKKSFRHDKE